MLATLMTAMMIDRKSFIFNYDCNNHTNKLQDLFIWTGRWENDAGEIIDLSKELMNIFESGHNSTFHSDMKIYFRSE